MKKNVVNVYGAGLAGCEAAWQIAQRGVKVRLFEMKPHKFSPAHHSEGFAELVCSNSLRSDSVTNGVGLLKDELRRYGSLIMEAADATRVPAGSALAVDRNLFSAYITEKIKSCDLIEVVEGEADSVDEDAISVIATGPLTSDAMSEYIKNTLGCKGLHFFDAAAPIVDFESINMDVAFFASRYDKGDADYINCPMTREQYEAFWEALISAREAELKDFDREQQKDFKVFEGCMPVEVMAKRGHDTLLFGPLKPVGLVDPRTKTESYAVVQLRRENVEGTMYNLVGFQTNLKFGEQKRVFSMIPALKNAEFVRYGVMHRNTFIDSPRLLNADFSFRNRDNLFFAGQITGVEGYMESASSGILAGLNMARRLKGLKTVTLPETTMMGALSRYISDSTVKNFQPMGANFGVLPAIEPKIRDKSQRYMALSQRATDDLNKYMEGVDAE